MKSTTFESIDNEEAPEESISSFSQYNQDREGTTRATTTLRDSTPMRLNDDAILLSHNSSFDNHYSQGNGHGMDNSSPFHQASMQGYRRTMSFTSWGGNEYSCPQSFAPPNDTSSSQFHHILNIIDSVFVTLDEGYDDDIFVDNADDAWIAAQQWDDFEMKGFAKVL